VPLFRSRELVFAVAGLSFVAALSALTTILSPPASDALPPGSSLSKGPAGSAAAYRALQSLGYDIRRSFEPMASLQLNPASTVVILAEPLQDASVGDRRALQSLIAAGATVLAAGCHAGSFFTDRPVAASRDQAPRSFSSLRPSPLTAGAQTISMTATCLRPDLSGRFLPLYGSDGNNVVAVSRVGNGAAIWWAGPTPLENNAIDRSGHLELLLNVVGPPGKTILWDEFYHGQQRSIYSYARHTPLPWLFAQLAVVGVVAAAMYARRQAPIIERAVEARVSPLEFVETMGGLYARAGTAADAVATARTRLKRLLADATGISAAADNEQLADAAAARLRVDRAEIASVLAAADDASRPGAAVPGEALSLVRRMQAIAAVVDRAGGL
jgi:hypothetical protein